MNMSVKYYLRKPNEHKIFNAEKDKIKDFVKKVKNGLEQSNIEYCRFGLLDFKNSLVNELNEPNDIHIANTVGTKTVKWFHDEKFIRDKVNNEKYVIYDEYDRPYTLDDFFTEIKEMLS